MSNNPELYKKLMEYNTTDYYPFHMPGHKRQFPGLYGMDITETSIVHNDILQQIICTIRRESLRNLWSGWRPFTVRTEVIIL